MKCSEFAWTAVIAAFVVSMAAAPAAAKGGSSNTKVKPTVKVPSARPATTTKARGASASSAAKAKAQTPKVKATGSAKATSGSRAASSKSSKSGGKPSLSSSGADTNPGNKPTLSSGNPASPGTSDTEPAPSDTNPVPGVPLNKAQQLLMKNDNLRLKMQTRLGGLDPIAQASQFRNLGQFVAAVNASYNNPNVSFLSLKKLMTGEPPMSLGQALQQLRGGDPTTAATTANRAQAQADADILSTSTAAKKTKTKPKS